MFERASLKGRITVIFNRQSPTVIYPALHSDANIFGTGTGIPRATGMTDRGVMPPKRRQV